jgi:hypothetical protein
MSPQYNTMMRRAATMRGWWRSCCGAPIETPPDMSVEPVDDAAFIRRIEGFCDSVECISENLRHLLRYRGTVTTDRPMCLSATMANIRLFYYVILKHTPMSPKSVDFNIFRVVIQDDTLSDDSKYIVLNKHLGVFSNVVVYQSETVTAA